MCFCFDILLFLVFGSWVDGFWYLGLWFGVETLCLQEARVLVALLQSYAQLLDRMFNSVFRFLKRWCGPGVPGVSLFMQSYRV